MAPGMMGTLHLASDAGYPILVKGRVVKVVDKVIQRDPGDPEMVVERYQDRYVTTVATLSQHGLELIRDVDAVEETMKIGVARTLLEAARLAQSAAARREKETLVKVPLMPLEAVVDRTGMLPKEGWLASFCKAEKARRRWSTCGRPAPATSRIA